MADMREITLTESREQRVEMTVQQANECIRIGERLSRQFTPGSENESDYLPSPISLSRSTDRSWTLKVNNAIGLFSVDDFQVTISPKIPSSHFNLIAAESDRIPTISDPDIGTSSNSQFWDLVPRWFVLAAKDVFRNDLRKGYESFADDLSYPRGKIVPYKTAGLLLRGRALASCEFEELTYDWAPNRVIKAAAALVAGANGMDRTVRKEAMRLLMALDTVGTIRASDLWFEPDLRDLRYSRAVHLARLVLENSDSAIESGYSPGSAFLFSTPLLVESGIRSIIGRAMPEPVVVSRSGSPRSTIPLNPDLIFSNLTGPIAVGDVKYKLRKSNWIRSDLYQVVAHAEGFGVDDALLVDFDESGIAPRIGQERIGEVSIVTVSWPCAVDPESALLMFSDVVASHASSWKN